MNFDKIIVGRSHGDLGGLTAHEFFSFLCGYHRDAKKATKHFQKFQGWMAGQTVAITKTGETIYYTHDIVRFMQGLPVID